MADSGKNCGRKERSPVFRKNGDWLTTSLSLVFSVRICVAGWGRFRRLVLRRTRNSPWCGSRVVRQRPHPCIRCSIFYDLHKKWMPYPSRSRLAKSAYDMSSPSGERCHAPPALRAARPAATVLLPKSASVNLATTFVVPTNRGVGSDESDRSGGAKRDYPETGFWETDRACRISTKSVNSTPLLATNQ